RGAVHNALAELCPLHDVAHASARIEKRTSALGPVIDFRLLPKTQHESEYGDGYEEVGTRLGHGREDEVETVVEWARIEVLNPKGVAAGTQRRREAARSIGRDAHIIQDISVNVRRAVMVPAEKTGCI